MKALKSEVSHLFDFGKGIIEKAEVAGDNISEGTQEYVKNFKSANNNSKSQTGEETESSSESNSDS